MPIELLSALELRARLQPSIERAAVVAAHEQLRGWMSIHSDFRRFESPIEQLFWFAWALATWLEGERDVVVELVPQQEIVTAGGKRYRADFMARPIPRGQSNEETVLAMRAVRAIVEIDGHEFHERTKAQVERRNTRDRDLQAEGYRVLHFAGSEIWRDPVACAQSVMLPLLNEGELAFYRIGLVR